MPRQLVLLGAFLSLLLVGPAQGQMPEKRRVLIETDIGGDRDDQASLVRFLLYSNEWDVEGIVADRDAKAYGKDGQADALGIPARDGLELTRAYLKAYAEVYPNLVKHDRNYPAPETLFQRTVAGFDNTDDAVRLIIAALDKPDPRPLWYANWNSNSGTTSNLLRALDRVRRERTAAEYRAFAGKLRICTLDGPGGPRQKHNDVIPLHIETGYPQLREGRWYHRLRPLTERAGGFDVDRDVRRNHGPLGALYTTPKEGDSWTFLYLIPNGLSDPEQPTWGSWAGRYGPRGKPYGATFFWANQEDTWQGKTNRDNTVARFAEHLQNDFRARLDWCVAEKYADANHAPIPHCQGDATRAVLRQDVAAGKPLTLSARGSIDPDGNTLRYRWYVYPEAGTYRGPVTLTESENEQATLQVPDNATGKTLHVILEVTDTGAPALTRYRRLVLSVK